jgi:hypothetical protein
VIDGWVVDVGDELFDDLLPLLRRTFGEFAGPERRMLGDRVRRLGDAGARPRARRVGAGDEAINVERASRVVPRLREILGIKP